VDVLGSAHDCPPIISFETVPAEGPLVDGFRHWVFARVRTTFSLWPRGRAVGRGPAVRGSTGCTLNLDESKRSILSKQSDLPSGCII